MGWIQQGAYIYVCGDASKRAKEVNAALKDIQKHVTAAGQTIGCRY
jgi:sulfite reductase alpha subunit-like flavoprotein